MSEITQMAFNRKEASKYLGISEKTLDKLLNDGRIKYQKIERTFIIPRVELDRFLLGDSTPRTLKEKVMEAYKKDGYIGALKLYRLVTDSCLRTAIDTVKPWCIECGYNPN